MPTPKPLYPAEFRRQMVELVRAGRKPTQLAREFNVTAHSISTWVAQAAADSGKPARIKDVVRNTEPEELARLRRERSGAPASDADLRQTGSEISRAAQGKYPNASFVFYTIYSYQLF